MESTSMCRCCATEGSFKDIKNPYYWMGEEEVYGDMLRECFDVKLTSVEQGGICEVCITQLRNASNFKKQVLNTEEQFKKHLNDIKFKATIVKEEVSADEDNDKFDSDDNPNHDDDDEDYVPEFEIPIKTETIEAKPKKRASTAKATTSRAKKTKTKKEEDSKSNRLKWISLKRKKKDTVKLLVMYTNANPVQKIKEMLYYCSYCDARYHSPIKLKEHSQENHKFEFQKFFFSPSKEFLVKFDITNLTCDLCDAPVDSAQEMVKHLMSQHEKKIPVVDTNNFLICFKYIDSMLRCAHCDAAFNTFQRLQMHINKHMANYTCEYCQATYKERKVFARHVETHTDKVRVKKKSLYASKCQHCDMNFNSYETKMDHLRVAHGLGVTHKCNSCNRVFTCNATLRRHVKRDHLLERNFKCSFCEKSFFCNVKLTNHLTVHTGAQNFQCEVCNKRVKTKGTLRVHMRTHTDGKQFKCENCGKAFAQKSWVSAHMKAKHGIIKDQA